MPASLGLNPEEVAAISAAEAELGEEAAPQRTTALGEVLPQLVRPIALGFGMFAFIAALLAIISALADRGRTRPTAPSRNRRSLQFSPGEIASIRAGERGAGYRGQRVRAPRNRTWMPEMVAVAILALVFLPLLKTKFEPRGEKTPEVAATYASPRQEQVLVAPDEWDRPKRGRNIILIYDSIGNARHRVSWMTKDESYPLRDTGERCDANGRSTWHEIVGIRFGVHQHRGFICVARPNEGAADVSVSEQ